MNGKGFGVSMARKAFVRPPRLIRFGVAGNARQKPRRNEEKRETERRDGNRHHPAHSEGKAVTTKTFCRYLLTQKKKCDDTRMNNHLHRFIPSAWRGGGIINKHAHLIIPSRTSSIGARVLSAAREDKRPVSLLSPLKLEMCTQFSRW